MQQVPYTLAIIKPDTASSQEKVDKVLGVIETAGLSVYDRVTRVLDKEDVLNLFAKFKKRDFFSSLQEYLMSGPVEILLLTCTEGDPIAKWKQIIGPSDPVEAKQKANGSLRALYGTTRIKNELHGSDDFRSASRERDIFDMAVPVREPPFVYDDYKVSLETLMKFLFPPHLEHPDVTGRLDIFAVYGPVVNSHSVDLGCFCSTCNRIARDKLAVVAPYTRRPVGKLSEAPQRLLSEESINEIWGGLCKDCQFHVNGYSHMPSGRGNQHLLADHEVTHLITSTNYNSLEELMISEKGKAGSLIMKTLELSPPRELMYTASHIRSLLGTLDNDFFGRMDFYDMQKLIMEDRLIRLHFWMAKLLHKPVDILPLNASGQTLKAEATISRTLPLSITDKKRSITQVTTFRERSIVDEPKMGANAYRVALLKRLSRDSCNIAEPKDLNSVDVAFNVLLLRDYSTGRHGGWDNYAALKGTGKGSNVKKSK